MGTTKSLALGVALSLLASSLTAILPAFAQADMTPPTGTVSINSGADATSSTSAILALTCDDNGGSGCLQIKVSVDGTFDTEAFEAFVASKAVTLPSADGVKIAMVIFKDVAGNESSPFSDDIALDTSTPDAPVITSPEEGFLGSRDMLEIAGGVSTNFVTEWGSFGVDNGEFNAPTDLAVGASGTRVYVADADNNRIQVFNLSGAFIGGFGSAGTDDGEFNGPVAIAVDSSNDVYVADIDNNRIQKFDSDGTHLLSWGSSGGGNGQFEFPQDVAVDSSDNVYVADGDNNRIQKFDSDGIFLTAWGTDGTGNGQFDVPTGVAVDSDDNVYVVDNGNNRIQKFDSDGNFLTTWGSLGADEGEFENPVGIATDSADNIYVADTDNNRIQKFTDTGTFVSQWGSEGSEVGQFSFPLDLATDVSGNIYVADTDNNRIQKFEADSGEASVHVFDGSTLLTTLTVPASSEWSFTASSLDDGEHELTAVAEDAAGNESDSSSPVTVLVHGLGPVNLSNDDESERPSVAASGSNVLVVWESDSGTPTSEVFYARSTDSGETFDSTVNLSANADDSFSPQALSDGNNVYIVWHDESSGNWEILLKKSTDNGEAFGGAVNVSNDDLISTDARMALDEDGDLHVVWNNEEKAPEGMFHSPVGAAIDSGGNLYIADAGNNRIQKFDSDGNFILQWGNSGAPASGDGQFDNPQDIAIDSLDNVYVVDSGNNRIQKFDSDGNFLTKWGTVGTSVEEFLNPAGIAIDSLDNVYVADATNNRVQKFEFDGTFILEWNSEVSSAGELSTPIGIAIDSFDDVYVVDSGNNRIQKFDSDGNFILEWGSFGTDDEEFDLPNYVAIDSSDDVYVTDYFNHRIQKFDSDGNFLTTWGDLGSDGGEFNNPAGIAADSSNVYVVDQSNHRVQKFDLAGTFPTEWGELGLDNMEIYYAKSADGGATFSTPLNISQSHYAESMLPDIAIDGAGRIHVVYEDDTPGNPDIHYTQSFDGGLNFEVPINLSNNAGDSIMPSIAAECCTIHIAWANDLLGGQFMIPQGIGADSSGNVYVTDSERNEIQKFDSNGEHILTWSLNNVEFPFAQQVATDSSGNVYVTDNSENLVQKFDSDGNFILEWDSSSSSAGEFTSPTGIAIDSLDNVYVVDNGNGRVQKFDSDGNFLLEWGQFGTDDDDFDYPYGIAIDSLGNVYVTDSFGGDVKKFNSIGAFITSWGTEGSADGEFFDARGIAVDSSDNVYVADAGNNRIQKFDSDGAHLMSWGSPGSSDDEFDYPIDVAISPVDDVYVVDQENIRIQKFTTDGEFVLQFGVFENFDIIYTKSIDAGATFSDPENLTENSGDSLSPALLPAGDNLYLTWDESSWIGFTPFPSDIMLYKSTDSGDTFSEAYILDENEENAAIPRLAESGRDIYAVWQAHTSEASTDVFFRSLSEFNNGSPDVDAGPDQTVDEGDLTTLDASATDPEDDDITFLWEQIGGSGVILSDVTAEDPTFTAPSILSDQVLTFKVTASDGIFGNSDTVSVSVEDSKGDLTIRKVEQGTGTLLAGAAFTITPNPFTLSGSLAVEDNGIHDSDLADGIIALQNVEFGTYTIEETTTPAGFVRIVQSVVVSVHSTQQDPTVTVENKAENQPVVDSIDIPSPDLTSIEFNNFVQKGAQVGGIAVTTVNDLPSAFLTPANNLPTLPEEISFLTEAPSDSTTQELLDLFGIPTYFSPEEGLAAGNVYIVPPIVIGHDDSTNNFLMTPLLSGTVSGMTLLFDQQISTATGDGQIKRVEMTFSDAGAVSNAAFSVSITDTLPANTPALPNNLAQEVAMFLTVDFIGDFGVADPDFSSEDAFADSPRVSVLVSRNLDVDLNNGCPVVSFFFFDEDEGIAGAWEEITDPERDPSLDTADYCGYVLETGHWSKFAVGGVKIATNVLQSIRHGGGGGVQSIDGSGSIGAGKTSNTSISVPGSGTIRLNFNDVSIGGSVKVSKSTFSQMSGLFTAINGNTATLSLMNNGRPVPYSTVGDLFDVDASLLLFKGPIEATIPYNPSLLPDNVSELELRFLHHTGVTWEDVTASVNTNENTVTGNMTSLSPLVPAVINDGTFDASYFEANPLKKMSILSANSSVISEPSIGKSQVALYTTIKNSQKTDQDYAVIIQVVDKYGYTESINWSTGNLGRGEESEVSVTATLSQGAYNVMVFAWDGVSNPSALSTISYYELVVPGPL